MEQLYKKHFIILFLTISTSLFAQEWTRFRGPDGSGLGKGPSIPVSFTESDYLWRVTLPGSGHSSPVLWGDRIFLICSHDEKEEREVVCLDANTGAKIWSKTLPFTAYKHNKLNSFAAASPAVDADHVYLNWITGDQFEALVFDHDGTKLWQKQMGTFAARHGAGASPICFDGLMIVGNDNKETSFLAGLNGKTGEPVWMLERQSKMTSYVTPAVLRPEGSPPEVIFVSEAYGFTAVNPLKGDIIWEKKGLFTLKSVASPVIAGDIVFATAGSGGGGKQSAAIRRGNSAAGQMPSVAWTVECKLPYVPTPIVVDQYLYIVTDSGILTCVDTATGKNVWFEDLNERFYASPVCVHGHLYLVTRKGEVLVVKTGAEYQLVARNKLPEESDATPAIAIGRMYIRTLNQLMCIGK